MSVSGFNDLPFELYELIAEYILDNLSALCALAGVSKRAYEAFNPILYKRIDTLTLPTLALTDEARRPLTGPHPASFVKSIVLEHPYRNPMRLINSGGQIYSRDEKAKIDRLIALAPTNSTAFCALASAAIRNVVFYGASVKSLEYRCKGLSLMECLSTFSTLERFVIGCSFPKKNPRKSLSISELLCGSSLTSFDFVWPKINPPSPSITAKILRQVQHACPNIARISLNQNIYRAVWDLQAYNEPFYDVLDDSTFTFPLLKQILICDCNEVFPRYEAFLLRHPDIQDLRYDGSMSPDGLIDPKLLPKLSRLDTGSDECIPICSSESRPIESLALYAMYDVLSLEKTLRRTPTLRRLCLYENRHYTDNEAIYYNGISLECVQMLTEACPRLTHFECVLEMETPLPTVYGTILSNLPNLEHLKVTMTSYSYDPDDRGNDMEYHRQTLVEALRIHDNHTLQTVQVDVFLWGEGDDDNIILEVQFYFERGSEGTLVAAQKSDRPEFRMRRLVSF